MMERFQICFNFAFKFNLRHYITAVGSKEVLERWVFDIEGDNTVTEASEGPDKPEKEITQEISAIIRQITASVTFLPLLEEPCTFDLLVYTNKDSAVRDVARVIYDVVNHLLPAVPFTSRQNQPQCSHDRTHCSKDVHPSL